MDASVALGLVLPDERSATAEEYLKGLNRIWVPALFWYEIANGLSMARRRKRLSPEATLRATALIEMLPVQVDPLLGPDAVRRLSQLASAHDLSAYDAAYLELALRKGGGLATLDAQLRRVAHRLGIPV
jgi:predicted nucleic acid-binding protein